MIQGMRKGPTFTIVLLALAIGGTDVAGAAAPGPSPSDPGAPAGSSGTRTESGGAVPDDLFRDDLFSAPPNPLTLAPVLATGRAISKVIGPKGGTIKARGADGTRYTLEVPRGAIPMGITITMTPVDELGGFPEGVSYEHALGVQLEPDGLPLAETATLTIQAKGKLPVELAARDYEGSGAEAGFHVFEAEGRLITIPVEHFSGYVVTFPTRADQIRAEAANRRTDPAAVLASEIATLLAIERQRQLMTEAESQIDGVDVSGIDLMELARAYLPLFLEVVLTPRIAAAGQGCAQAEAAIAAILAYERHRQLLGVGADEAFALYTGASELARLPARLLDLRVRLCFREAHAQCVRTGDFPAMAAYFFAALRQAEVNLGVEPTAEHIEIAHGYLRRCGRYRAVVLFDSPDQEPADYERKERFRVEVELGWKPGSGSYGILGSTVEGEGEHQDIDFAFRSAGCSRGRGTNVANVATRTPPGARIASLAYDLVYGPTRIGGTLPPQPRSLELEVSLGSIRYDYDCTDERETQEYEFALAAFGQLDAPATRDLGSAGLRIKDRWAFEVGPFKATWRFRDRFPIREGGLALELDVTLLHEPG